MALEKQPDQIHLTPEPNHSWANDGEVKRLATPLVERGFQEAGVYSVDEMDGVIVRLMVQPEQNVAACIYEHPQVGHWLDVVCRYQDGRGITYTNSRPTGMDPRPGNETVRAQGAGSDELYDRLIRERPTGDLVPYTVANVADRFMSAYAEEMAWRKNRGVSACEVARNMQMMSDEGGSSHDCREGSLTH
jgi:hypothetical protein